MCQIAKRFLTIARIKLTILTMKNKDVDGTGYFANILTERLRR